MITIDLDHAAPDLASLISSLEQQGEAAYLVRAGQPVAELRPLGPRIRKITQHPVLSQVVFLEDPMAPLDEEDWPEAYR
jgi:hypothetical protein